MNSYECPVYHLSLHTKLNECVKAGILKERPVKYPGVGEGISLTLNGVPITVKRRIRGTPCWDNGVPPGLYFDDFHDVAFCAETSTLITWALAL